MKLTEKQITSYRPQYERERKQSRDIWAAFCDPLAVRAVSIVADKIAKDGKLYGYDGVKAAREIRDLFANKIIDGLWSRSDATWRKYPRKKTKLRSRTKESSHG